MRGVTVGEQRGGSKKAVNNDSLARRDTVRWFGYELIEYIPKKNDGHVSNGRDGGRRRNLNVVYLIFTTSTRNRSVCRVHDGVLIGNIQNDYNKKYSRIATIAIW